MHYRAQKKFYRTHLTERSLPIAFESGETLDPKDGETKTRGYLIALFPCYTDFVLKNVTIKISEEALFWARRKAAEENTSVSRLVGEMLERQMRLSDEYWRAFDRWKSHRGLAEVGAAERLSREDLHERR